ncbi:unnamed protein product [Brassica oleracea]
MVVQGSSVPVKISPPTMFCLFFPSTSPSTVPTMCFLLRIPVYYRSGKRFRQLFSLSRFTIVCLSVFDVQASQIHQKLVGVCVEPKVILTTSINPKFVGGAYYWDNELGQQNTSK